MHAIYLFASWLTPVQMAGPSTFFWSMCSQNAVQHVLLG